MSQGPVIIGVDGTERAADAVALGRLLADAASLPAVLASVYPAAESSRRDGGRRRAEAAIARVAPDAAYESRTIADLSVPRALHRLARETGASLLCVGASHRRYIGRAVPGSNSERLLHGAPCPVAVAPAGFGGRPAATIRLIGCGYDGGAEAKTALAVAARLAAMTHARLKLIAVSEPPHVSAPGAYGAIAAAALADSESWLSDCVRQAVDALPPDLGVESLVETGTAARTLCVHSRELDVLVLGSRGYGPLHAVLVGGVAGRVVRDGACPVLVVPRGCASGPWVPSSLAEETQVGV